MPEQNTQPNEEAESIVLDLENLSAQYSNLLIQYEQAVANYSALMQQQTTGKNTPLMSIPDNAFWGTGRISTSSGKSLQKCQALCSATRGCSGATYNPTNKNCSLRSGKGSLVPDSISYAIVPEETYLLLNMQSINTQLIRINQEILDKTSKGETYFNDEYAERKVKSQELLQNYIMLNRERERINQIVKSYEDLNTKEVEGNIKINQNYYSFILLIILAIALIVILYLFSGSSSATASGATAINPNPSINPYQTEGQLGISAYFIVFAIILIVLVVKYFSNISSFVKSFY
jgi:hypothetical protein